MEYSTRLYLARGVWCCAPGNIESPTSLYASLQRHLLLQVYTEREWKKTKYAGKTKTMPEGIADVDMALDKTLVFE